MIERVDVHVAGLAGVAGARLQKPSRQRPSGSRQQLHTPGLIVDPIRGAGGGQGGDRTVIGHYLVAALRTALRLDTLEDSGRRPPDRHGVRVLAWELVELGQHPKAARQVSGQYSGLPGTRRPALVVCPSGWRLVLVDGHSENCTPGARPPFTSPSRTAARSADHAERTLTRSGAPAKAFRLQTKGADSCLCRLGPCRFCPHHSWS